MIKSLTILAAAAASTLVFAAATPAAAQAPSYLAKPVTAPAQAGSVIVGDTLWACGTDGCTTARATSRPAIVCEQVAKRLGRLDSFTVGGASFDAEALARCNTKAKDAPTALARN